MLVRRLMVGAGSAFALAVMAVAAVGPASAIWADDGQSLNVDPPGTVHRTLTAPPQLAACMPRGEMTVTIKPTEEQKGFDIFEITARHVAPNRDYTVFLLEQANFPFGASEYIGELSVNGQGNGHAEYHLIVQEAFASTIVNGQRVRADLHEIGLWFADPKDDDFCLGPNGGPVTPFDGDNSAGGLAFSSAPLVPAPAVTSR